MHFIDFSCGTYVFVVDVKTNLNLMKNLHFDLFYDIFSPLSEYWPVSVGEDGQFRAHAGHRFQQSHN